MKLYDYYIFHSLDWEYCFLSVEDYKKFLEKKYKQCRENHHCSLVEPLEVIKKVDEVLQIALVDWKRKFPRGRELRCDPMVFPLPNADNNGASFCIILKSDEDGDTFIYSPIPLSYLE